MGLAALLRTIFLTIPRTMLLVASILNAGLWCSLLIVPFAVPPIRHTALHRNVSHFALRAISTPWLVWFNIDCRILDRKYPAPPRAASKGGLLMFQHASNLEAFILANWWRGSLLSVGKAELYYIPIIGWIGWLGGHVAIKRSNLKAAKNSLSAAVQRCVQGYTVAISPEGTRRRARSVGTREDVAPFKKGPFHAAVQLWAEVAEKRSSQKGQYAAPEAEALTSADGAESRPLCLVAWDGSNRAWQPGNVLPTAGARVVLRVVDDHFVPENTTDHDALREEVRAKYMAEYDSGRAPVNVEDDGAHLPKVPLYRFEMFCTQFVCAALWVVVGIIASGKELGPTIQGWFA